MQFYIDPGTGSMLFTILIGLVGVIRYACKAYLVKLKFFFGGGRRSKNEEERVPLVIFADDKRYWQIFAPVCRELAKKNFPVKYLTFSEDDPALQCGYAGLQGEYIGHDNHAFAKLNFLKADVLLSTTPGLNVYQWKRSREVQCYVHLPHASTDITLYRMFGIDYYDAVLLSGEYQVRQIRALEQLRNLPAKETVLVGVPYLDEMLLRRQGLPAVKNERTTVLLAPSWGPSAILTKFGAKMIRSLLATGYHIVVRPHPQSFQSEGALMAELQKEFPPSEQLEWNRDADNFAVLNRSDILISDFSGVIFDFALIFDRPVIYTDTQFDKGVYDAWWLAEEPWVLQKLPALGMELNEHNFEYVKDLIDACLQDKKFVAGREEARRETWVHQGAGARLVADYLLEKCAQIGKLTAGKVGA